MRLTKSEFREALIDFMVYTAITLAGMAIPAGLILAWYFDDANYLLISALGFVFFLAG